MLFSEIVTSWLPLPNGVSADRPMFVLTDVHGHADLMKQAIALAAETSQGHELVILGDLTDRGPDSLGCVRAAVAARSDAAFSRVITLMGNHDEVLSGFVHDPSDEAQRGNVIMMGGRGFLNEFDRDPGASDVLEAYVRGLVRHHANGGLALTHALPDPNLPLRDQKDSTLAWNSGHQDYRGGWDSLLGRPTILVHGHVRNGVTLLDKPLHEAEEQMFSTLSRCRRICCDVGTPWTNEVALFEFVGEHFRAHGFKRTA